MDYETIGSLIVAVIFAALSLYGQRKSGKLKGKLQQLSAALAEAQSDPAPRPEGCRECLRKIERVAAQLEGLARVKRVPLPPLVVLPDEPEDGQRRREDGS